MPIPRHDNPRSRMTGSEVLQSRKIDAVIDLDCKTSRWHCHGARSQCTRRIVERECSISHISRATHCIRILQPFSTRAPYFLEQIPSIVLTTSQYDVPVICIHALGFVHRHGIFPQCYFRSLENRMQFAIPLVHNAAALMRGVRNQNTVNAILAGRTSTL